MAEHQPPRHVLYVNSRNLPLHRAGGLGDQIREVFGGHGGRRRREAVSRGRAVKPDQGVEVDCAAAWELGHLAY
ncbi:MAG TPA: hypothetical protein VEQ66_14260 [Propionibacteriaceae bacterium]|nr:hypothetical protein [Propionibacteriaceae bacterium]